jgi:hypothetical protein
MRDRCGGGWRRFMPFWPVPMDGQVGGGRPLRTADDTEHRPFRAAEGIESKGACGGWMPPNQGGQPACGRHAGPGCTGRSCRAVRCLSAGSIAARQDATVAAGLDAVGLPDPFPRGSNRVNALGDGCVSSRLHAENDADPELCRSSRDCSYRSAVSGAGARLRTTSGDRHRRADACGSGPAAFRAPNARLRCRHPHDGTPCAPGPSRRSSGCLPSHC